MNIGEKQPRQIAEVRIVGDTTAYDHAAKKIEAETGIPGEVFALRPINPEQSDQTTRYLFPAERESRFHELVVEFKQKGVVNHGKR